MDIIPYNNEQREVWDRFCIEHPESWFWHTSTWMEYTMNSSLTAIKKNLSFLVMKNNTLLAVVPLIQEQNDQKITFSYSGGPIPAPLIRQGLSEKENKNIELVIYEHIKQKGIESNAQSVQIRKSNEKINEISNAGPTIP